VRAPFSQASGGPKIGRQVIFTCTWFFCAMFQNLVSAVAASNVSTAYRDNDRKRSSPDLSKAILAGVSRGVSRGVPRYGSGMVSWYLAR
jgi:hypothetical protein